MSPLANVKKAFHPTIQRVIYHFNLVRTNIPLFSIEKHMWEGTPPMTDVINYTCQDFIFNSIFLLLGECQLLYVNKFGFWN